MFNAKRLFKYLATGTLPEMTTLDADPIGHHPDGSPCYTDGCRRGGIPWANIQKHNAKEKAQMKLDLAGKGTTEAERINELKKELRVMDTDALAGYLHAHEDDETSPEFKAVMAEIYRRDAIAQGKRLTDLGERA